MGEINMKRIGTQHWSIIKSLLPPTAELVVMPKPHDQPAVIIADLDGDNHQEIACVYRNQGEMYVMVAKQDENRWHPIGNFKGQGYTVSDLLAAPIVDAQMNSLLIGWQIGGVWSNIDILQWTANGFMHMLHQETRASRVEVEDMPGVNGTDGNAELALWLHDSGKAFQVEVYRWDAGNLVIADDVYPYYFQKMVTYYESVLEERDSARYWYYLGDAQRKAGMHAQAFQSIERALQFPNPYPSREALLRRKKELDAAKRKN
ncbi:hypothetical protein HPY28_18965 [Brevibacillus sp. HB1.2]|uniref:hypothetical protein n=1 Tax=Brevibacillus TaxID=55080 RepID=UPI0015775B4B|nr:MULTISPECIES: hypothetical protein [unclassified Brevibacillus]NTU22408.1 hypothetical protein [Brevibacillus sp. HB1.2]NTU33284.1 hypothetical protein [Brevibacillus sp. HB1.1]